MRRGCNLKVHQNHIKAGCEIITTNTFSTCRHALDAIGHGNQTSKINSEAVKLAQKAIDTTGAGDAFNGGLAYGLSKEKPNPDRVIE